MLLTASLAVLVLATAFVIIRRRGVKTLLVAWAGFLIFAAGTCALALEDAGEARSMTECRTLLSGDSACAGINDSWTECRWAFRAEGRPDHALCERFLRLPLRYRGRGEPKDYDDVRAFSEVDCDPWDLSSDDRCFEGTRAEPEATHRYLQTFNSDCTAALVLRSCNYGLDVAASQTLP